MGTRLRGCVRVFTLVPSQLTQPLCLHKLAVYCTKFFLSFHHLQTTKTRYVHHSLPTNSSTTIHNAFKPCRCPPCLRMPQLQVHGPCATHICVPSSCPSTSWHPPCNLAMVLH